MSDPRPLRAAVATLAILQVIMLSTLLAGVPPHPPASTPIAAMGPMLAAAIAVCIAAWNMAESALPARALAGLAAVFALISFGPQKYVDPAFPAIWPAVLTAQASILTIFVQIMPARSKARPVPA